MYKISLSRVSIKQDGHCTPASSLTREDLDVGHLSFFLLPALVAAALDDGGSVDHLVEGDERRRRRNRSTRRINFCCSRPEDVSLARCLLRAWKSIPTAEDGERERACVRAGSDGQDRSELGPAVASSATEPIPPRGGRLSRPPRDEANNWNGGVRVLEEARLTLGKPRTSLSGR